MSRYRVFVGNAPYRHIWTSATFPFPEKTDSWLGAVLRAMRMSRLFAYVMIERVDATGVK